MTRADLDARMEEPWFDPEGLILVVPADDPDTVAASHWTKIPLAAPGGAHASGEGRGASRGRSGRSTWSRSTPHTKGGVWGAP